MGEGEVVVGCRGRKRKSVGKEWRSVLGRE